MAVRVAVVAVVFAAVAGLGGPARADDADDARRLQEGAAALEAGVAAYDEGTRLTADGKAVEATAAFTRALGEFERAYHLTSAWEVLVQIGATNSRLTHYRAAALALEEYLAKATGLAPDQVDAVKAEVARLRALLVEVTVQIRAGAPVISVDGAELGTWPLAGPLRLDPGDHVLTAVATEGGQRFERTARVTLASGTPAEVELTPATRSRLLITSRPTGATIAVDGVDAGTAPLSVDVLSKARHVFAASLDGYVKGIREASFEAGVDASLAIDLVAEPRPWYRRPSTWIAVGAGVALIAGVTVGYLMSGPNLDQELHYPP